MCHSTASTAMLMEVLAVSPPHSLGSRLLIIANQWPWTLASVESILLSCCGRNREKAVDHAETCEVAEYHAVKEIVTLVDVCVKAGQPLEEALGHGRAMRDHC